MDSEEWGVDNFILLTKYIVMKNIIADKSYAFAIRIVNLYKHLSTEKKEFVLSKQLLKSGTAIGALVKEAEHAQSKADFLNKMNIALKEANETEYWLMLQKDTGYLSQTEFSSMKTDCSEIMKLLISIVKQLNKTLRNNEQWTMDNGQWTIDNGK